MDGVSDECDPEWMDSEDPLFILYTSGSTGKPKASHSPSPMEILIYGPYIHYSSKVRGH